MFHKSINVLQLCGKKCHNICFLNTPLTKFKGGKEQTYMNHITDMYIISIILFFGKIVYTVLNLKLSLSLWPEYPEIIPTKMKIALKIKFSPFFFFVILF